MRHSVREWWRKRVIGVVGDGVHTGVGQAIVERHVRGYARILQIGDHQREVIDEAEQIWPVGVVLARDIELAHPREISPGGIDGERMRNRLAKADLPRVWTHPARVQRWSQWHLRSTDCQRKCRRYQD